MINRKLLFLAAVLPVCLAFLPAIALAAGAPANDAEQISSYIQNSVAADAEKETGVKTGQALEIILRENLTTPVRWYYKVSDEEAIRLLHEYYESDPNPEEMDGVGGTHYYYFIAETPGEYEIRFQDNSIGDGYLPGNDWELIYKLTVTD